jgi:hypothetical protein
VQSRALVALHNLLLSLSTTEALYSKEALCNLWNLLFKLAAGDAAGGTVTQIVFDIVGVSGLTVLLYYLEVSLLIAILTI